MFVISNPDEAAWLGWFAQADGYDGYLRWAYNSWTLDPLTDARFRTWPAGDCFVVYPGGRGSVRFSKLVEGIQDFEKVRILRSRWQETGTRQNSVNRPNPQVLHLRDSPRRRPGHSPRRRQVLPRQAVG